MFATPSSEHKWKQNKVSSILIFMAIGVLTNPVQMTVQRRIVYYFSIVVFHFVLKNKNLIFENICQETSLSFIEKDDNKMKKK